MTKPASDRILGALLGLALCEAIAPPDTGDILRPDPMTALPEGRVYADGTAMSLSLAESFIANRSFDPRDQMIRYTSWYRYGHLSAAETCGFIDESLRQATLRFERDWAPFDTSGAENALCLTRLVPVVAFAGSSEEACELATDSAKVTHSGQETCAVCATLGSILFDLLRSGTHGKPGNLPQGPVWDILKDALQAVATAESFSGGLAALPNTPRTWAVYGQLAGARFGVSGLPTAWIHSLAGRQQIESLASQLFSL